jgi:hypothetical protein
MSFGGFGPQLESPDMAEPAFSHPDDDLPRTLRRERDARQRASQPTYSPQARAASLDMPGDGVAVTRFDVPFFRLAWFLMKCVIAGIPALLLLGVVLFGIGKGLQQYAPGMRLFEIEIRPINTGPVNPGKTR